MIFISFQYKRDNTNQEAYSNLQQIEPLEQDIANAKILFENHEYQGAIQLLSKAIEVNYIRFWNFFFVCTVEKVFKVP